MISKLNIFVFNLLLFQILFQSCDFVNAKNEQCAQLKSNSSNATFIIRNGIALGNIGEEFLTKDQAWNVPASWTVEPSCELRACDGVYFTGTCKTFSGGATSDKKTWLSAECKCSEVCSCSQVHLKRNVCARAYLEEGGCQECGKTYTELPPGDHPTFSENFSNKIQSILVRNGCTLKLYEEENHEGEYKTAVGGYVPNWTGGSVGSYECECNDENYVPRGAPTVIGNHPELLVIPIKGNDVSRMLRENNYTHPGLLASFLSLVNGRSSKNAYILAIGSSGAGKSSAINILLDQQNLTASGEYASTTSEILEFRIPLPLPHLGISNSELRIIDTPGLSDTRGAENDANFLATLDEFLSKHEELQDRIPNVVLLFHYFTDNRYDGDSAKFVKMIRALNNFRSKITDDDYSNVIFVFSHFCSSDKSSKKNPLPRLMRFKDVIEKYSLFPKPIMTSVVENKGHDNNLPMRDSNYILPNGELYPSNLITKIDALSQKGKDPIGNSIFDGAFVYKLLGEDVNATVIKHSLVNSTSNWKVTKYLKFVNAAALSCNTTEVSLALSRAYHQQLSLSLKRELNPNYLERLQRFLNNRNIYSLTDIPQTSLEILKLLKELRQSGMDNDATAFLLDRSLDLRPPSFPGSILAGQSYSIVKDRILPLSPFNLEEIHDRTVIGFGIPKALECLKSYRHVKNPSTVFKNKDQYLMVKLLKEIGIWTLLAKNQEMLNNIKEGRRNGFLDDWQRSCAPTEQNPDCSVVGYDLFETFRLKLNSGNDTAKATAKLTPEFIRRVNELQDFDEGDYENVQNWRKFFEDYGTHVVTEVIGGGVTELQLNSTYISEEGINNNLTFLESLHKLESIPHTQRFYGGNPSYHFPDMAQASSFEGVTLMEKWKQSLDFYPYVFANKVEEIGDIVEEFISEEAAMKFIKPKARLFSSTLNYVAPPPTPDPRIVEMQRQQNETQANIRKLEEEKRKAQETLEKNRKEAEEQEKKRKKEQLERERRQKETLFRMRMGQALIINGFDELTKTRVW